MFSKSIRTHSIRCSLPLLVFALCARMAHGADALNFFQNWFVDGDYASAGTGLSTTNGVGTITLSSVPCTSGTGPASKVVGGALPQPFPGGGWQGGCDPSYPGAVPAYPVAAFLYWETVENSNTASGAAGTFDGYAIQGKLLGSDSSSACWIPTAKSQTLRVYRADVLRFLPLAHITHVNLANGAHHVALGNASGTAPDVLETEGASLVVIYRLVVPGNPLIVPLRAVVIYDGAYTISENQQSLSQTIAGFYQASSTNPAATQTHIVGNGQSGYRAQLKVNNDTPGAASGNRPFIGAQGANWDNLTFGFNLNTNAAATPVQVTEVGSVNDCLSWGAIVTSTNVQDSDHDGLLDVWETNGLHRNTQVSPATFGGCSDYPNEPCVDLPAMGAVNGKQDIFLQVDWMHGYGDHTGGVDGTGSHDHIPKLAALDAVAKTFATHNIALHFDVGNNYQGLGLPYIIPYTTDRYGNLLPQGGSDIDENTLLCHSTTTTTCAYNQPYPVLSFKYGLQSVRDGNALLNLPAHFQQNRKDLFHYVLFAHAMGGPYNPDGTAAFNPPKSVSGVADRPGGDIMITLGLWRSDIPANDQVGSTLVEAGTLMHELGHNLDLSHGGWNSTPNCMPDYPSVMNYLYQTRGLTDASGAEHIDYSYGTLAGVNESNPGAVVPPLYRIRYYAPLNLLTEPAGQAAQLHCDGTALSGGASYTRLETPGLSSPNWSNGTNNVGPPFDVNFDGSAAGSFSDQPDWSSLNLQQVGTRAKFGLFSSGVLDTDLGVLDTDLGVLDTDLGVLDTDLGVLDTDLGVLDTDLGVLDTDLGVLDTDLGDIDYDTLIQSSVDPPPTAQQCSGCGLTAASGLSGITLNWTPPDTGGNLSYNIYRCAGAGCTPTNLKIGSTKSLTFTDTVNDFVDAGATCPAASTCYNTVYVYAVTAVSPAGVESPFSNTTAPGNEVAHLFVVADPQTVVYGTANPSPTFKVYGDVAGSLSSALVSCAYVPAAPRNARSYQIACTGPAAVSATDGVTYVPDAQSSRYLTYSPGTLTISPRPITVTAVASSKTYDGTVNSSSTPAITSGSLAYSDTPALTETYDNKDVGTTHTMTPAGTINDGNGGNNYNIIKFVPFVGGIILTRPVTPTLTASSKPYDGTNVEPNANMSCTLANAIAGDNIACTASGGTFNSSQVLTANQVTATVTLSGTAAGDYTFGALGSAVSSTSAMAASSITPAPLAITAKNQSKTYGSAFTFTGSEFTRTTLYGSDTVTSVTLTSTGAAATAGVGGYPIVPSNAVGTGLSNYTISYANGTLTVNPAPLIITAKNASKNYGQTLTFAGTEFTAATLYNSDAVTSATLTSAGAAAAAAVGGYPIVPSNAVGTGLSNYTISYANGTLTVNPVPAVITLSSPILQPYTGNPVPVTPTVTPALCGPAGVTYNGSSTPPSAIGSYTVQASIVNPNCSGNPVNGTLIIFGYPATGTAFVIGDVSAANKASTQTFWDNSQWYKDNSLSGGVAPSSFKGYAAQTSSTPPACGGTWTTNTGSSPAPPAAIPGYMAVVVSSSITQKGSNVTGNISQIVVMSTSAYSTNSLGTGTIVGTLCPSN